MRIFPTSQSQPSGRASPALLGINVLSDWILPLLTVTAWTAVGLESQPGNESKSTPASLPFLYMQCDWKRPGSPQMTSVWMFISKASKIDNTLLCFFHFAVTVLDSFHCKHLWLEETVSVVSVYSIKLIHSLKYQWSGRLHACSLGAKGMLEGLFQSTSMPSSLIFVWQDEVAGVEGEETDHLTRILEHP